MNSLEVPEYLWTHFWQLTSLIVISLVILRAFPRRPYLAHALWVVILLKAVTPPILSSPGGVFSRWNGGPRVRTVSPSVSLETLDPEWLAVSDNLATEGNGDQRRVERNTTIAAAEVDSTETLVVFLLCVWLAGAASTTIRTARTWSRCKKQLLHGNTVPPDLLRLLTSLKRKLGVKLPVQLYLVKDTWAPCVIGIFKPRIVLPNWVVSRPDSDIKAILAHELIHVRRGDLILGPLQFLALVTWWFHPLMRVALRRLREVCEQCIDEAVVAELKCPPSQYARALLSVLENNRSARPVPLVPAVHAVEVTSRRMERILAMKQGCRSRTPWWYWIVVIVAATATLPGAAYVANATGDNPSTRVYQVERLIDDLKQQQGLTQAQAKERLKSYASNVVQAAPDVPIKANPPLPVTRGKAESPRNAEIKWFGNDLVVRCTAEEHEALAEMLSSFKRFGFRPFHLEAHVFTGPVKLIEELRGLGDRVDTTMEKDVRSVSRLLGDRSAATNLVERLGKGNLRFSANLIVYNGREASFSNGPLGKDGDPVAVGAILSPTLQPGGKIRLIAQLTMDPALGRAEPAEGSRIKLSRIDCTMSDTQVLATAAIPVGSSDRAIIVTVQFKPIRLLGAGTNRPPAGAQTARPSPTSKSFHFAKPERRYAKTYAVGDLVTPYHSSNQTDANISKELAVLRNLLIHTVAKTSWVDFGGEGAVEPFEPNLSLVVHQTEKVHDQIGETLAALRKRIETQVTISTELIVVTAAQFKKLNWPRESEFEIVERTPILDELSPGHRIELPRVTVANRQGIVLAMTDGALQQLFLIPQFGHEREDVGLHLAVNTESPLEALAKGIQVRLPRGRALLWDISTHLNKESPGGPVWNLLPNSLRREIQDGKASRTLLLISAKPMSPDSAAQRSVPSGSSALGSTAITAHGTVGSERSQTKSIRGIPLLGDIPYVGSVFRAEQTDSNID